MTIKDIKNLIVEDNKYKFDSFKMKNTLAPGVWEENKTLNPEIRKKLLKIAISFYESLKIPNVKIKDIIITGSLANYNWSKYSDIDLHILIDFNEVDENYDLVKQLMDAKRALWNNNHEIKIKDFEVEIYMQDINEPHKATGQYSVLKDQWKVEPNKQSFSIDFKLVRQKADEFMKIIDYVEEVEDERDYNKALKIIDCIKKKIKHLRKSGLERGGEFSYENIAFKVLRRNGYLEKLFNLQRRAYDEMMSENMRGFI